MDLKDLESTTEQDFERTFNLNVKGPYFLAQVSIVLPIYHQCFPLTHILLQKAAPHMQPGSHIIFVSTSVAHTSTVTPNYLLYCASKGAIEQMTRVMSKDLARKGISVNAVAPGPTATDLFMKGKSDQLLKTIAGFSPHNRIGQPEEIADVFVFLSGEGSRWMSGQLLGVNGGMASM